MNRNEQLVKNSIILGFGSLVPKLLSLLVLPILTRGISQEEFGEYDLILSVTSLVVPVITLQVQQAVFRFMIAEAAEKRGVYATTALAFAVAVSLGSAPFVGLGLWRYGFTPAVTAASCLLVIGNSLYLVAGQALRGVGDNVRFTMGTIVYSACNLVSVTVLIGYLHLGLFGVVLSVALSYNLSSIYMLLRVNLAARLSMRSVHAEALKELLLFSLPIVPSSVSLWIVNLSDRLIVVGALGAAANGIYSVASKIPLLYSAAYNIFSLSWTETASRARDEDDDYGAYYSEMFNKLFKFLVGIMLVVVTASPVLYWLFIDKSYAEAYVQTAILFFGVFFNSMVSFYAGIYIALKRTREIGLSSMVGAAINVAFNILFIKRLGLYAASVSTVLSYLTIAIFRAIDLQKAITIDYDVKSFVVGMGCFLICVLLFCQQSLAAFVACGLIALIYNIKYNIYFAKWLLSKVLHRINLKGHLR